MATKIYLGYPPEHIKNWIIKTSIEETKYPGVCFTAEEPNSTIKLTKPYTYNQSYQISYDGESWEDYRIDTIISLANVNDKVYFKAKTTNETCNGSRFTMTGKIASSGNIQYLLDSTGERMDVPENCYYYMFYYCKSLTQAPELPATTLSEDCYDGMFQGCISLIQAPKLPAMTLANSCYEDMFGDCRSLTQAPELPATTLATDCYHCFVYGSGVTKLTMSNLTKEEFEQQNGYNTLWSDSSTGGFTGTLEFSDGETIYVNLYGSPCFLKGTKITLADMTQKNVEDITYDDDLLVWNFDEGKLDSAKPLWIMKPHVTYHYWKNTFESGNEIYTTGVEAGHRFFDIESNTFKYNTEMVGNRTFKQDLTTDKLLTSERIEGVCEYYNLVTDRHINCFANGILASCSLNNIYPIEDMKFIKDGRAPRTINDFNVSQNWFDGCRYAEQPLTIEYLNEYYNCRKNIQK